MFQNEKKKISRKKSKQVKVKVWDIGVFSQKYQILRKYLHTIFATIHTEVRSKDISINDIFKNERNGKKCKQGFKTLHYSLCGCFSGLSLNTLLL